MSVLMGDMKHFDSRRNFEYCRCNKVEEVDGAMRKMSRLFSSSFYKFTRHFFDLFL